MLIFTKSVVQILLWQIITMAIYTTALEEIPRVIKIRGLPDWSSIVRDMIIEALILLYPIGIIVGDVCWGRYKTVISSLIIITVSMLSSSIGAILLFVRDGMTANTPHDALYVASLALAIISAPIFIVGFTLFSSTIIQFGLDQLIDKPSESLGVFVHWLVWAFKVGILLVKAIYISKNCANHEIFKIVSQSTPMCFLVLLLTVLLISWCTRHHLNHDSVLYNPYK